METSEKKNNDGQIFESAEIVYIYIYYIVEARLRNNPSIPTSPIDRSAEEIVVSQECEDVCWSSAGGWLSAGCCDIAERHKRCLHCFCHRGDEVDYNSSIPYPRYHPPLSWTPLNLQ
jgi:hypothetical protein